MTGRVRVDTPPTVGPYGRAEQVDGRWRIRLTKEGERVCEEFLAEFPHPRKLLLVKYQRTLSFAANCGLKEGDIDAAAREGVMRAVAKWEPGESSLFNYARIWVRGRVARAAEQFGQFQRLSGVKTVSGGERSDGRLSRLASKTDRTSDPSNQETVAVIRERVSKALATVNDRDRRLFEMRYGLAGEGERTLEETGKEFGVTKERVRQICKRVCVMLVKDLEPIWRSLEHKE